MVVATKQQPMPTAERHLAAVQEAVRPPTRSRGAPAFVRVMIATFLVAICPVLLVWWLRLSGTLASPLASMGAGVALSLTLANLGAAYWKRHPASRDLLFNELLLWGYLYRRLRERRLASARTMLGLLSAAPGEQERPRGAEERARVLERLARMLDARDPLTHGHSRRVARHAWMLAQRMGLSSEEIARIRTAAAIHDIGKMNTPLEILRKPARLSDAEFTVIKRHPVDGAQIAAALRDKKLCAIIRHHHERLDGSGYPDGLAGEQIPVGARIISVADTFDAITSVRPYQTSRSHQQALEILRTEAGDRLDPEAVRAFCTHYSGRRPLTAWATLTSLPEGIFARVGGALFGGTGPVKLAALAMTLGGVTAATGALSLVVPAGGHRAPAQAQSSAAGVQLAGTPAPSLLLPEGRSGGLFEGPPGGPARARMASVRRSGLIETGAQARLSPLSMPGIGEPLAAAVTPGDSEPAAGAALDGASAGAQASHGARARKGTSTAAEQPPGSAAGGNRNGHESARSEAHAGGQAQPIPSEGDAHGRPRSGGNEDTGGQGRDGGSATGSEASRVSAGGPQQQQSAPERSPPATGSEATAPVQGSASSGAGSSAQGAGAGTEITASAENAGKLSGSQQPNESGRTGP